MLREVLELGCKANVHHLNQEDIQSNFGSSDTLRLDAQINTSRKEAHSCEQYKIALLNSGVVQII